MTLFYPYNRMVICSSRTSGGAGAGAGSSGSSNDFVMPLGRQWIVAYTIWDMAFVYGNFESCGNSIILLLTPILLCIRLGRLRRLLVLPRQRTTTSHNNACASSSDNDDGIDGGDCEKRQKKQKKSEDVGKVQVPLMNWNIWLQMRSFTLGAYMLYYFAEPLKEKIDTSAWSTNETGRFIVHLVVLVVNVGLHSYDVYLYRAQRSNIIQKRKDCIQEMSTTHELFLKNAGGSQQV